MPRQRARRIPKTKVSLLRDWAGSLFPCVYRQEMAMPGDFKERAVCGDQSGADVTGGCYEDAISGIGVDLKGQACAFDGDLGRERS